MNISGVICDHTIAEAQKVVKEVREKYSVDITSFFEDVHKHCSSR